MTNHLIRSSPVVLHTYRSLQIVFKDFNQVNMRFLQIVLNSSIITITVLCIFVFVRFHDILGLGACMVFLSGIVGGLTFILLTYLKFGAINFTSMSVLCSWRRFQEYPSSGDRELMLSYIHSLAALRLHLGSFGYYKKANSLPMIGKLVYYTAKFLLMTKEFT